MKISTRTQESFNSGLLEAFWYISMFNFVLFTNKGCLTIVLNDRMRLSFLSIFRLWLTNGQRRLLKHYNKVIFWFTWHIFSLTKHIIAWFYSLMSCWRVFWDNFETVGLLKVPFIWYLFIRMIVHDIRCISLGKMTHLWVLSTFLRPHFGLRVALSGCLYQFRYSLETILNPKILGR